MKKQKIYSRWQFESKDYRVIRHEEVTEGEKRDAADLLTSIVSSTEISGHHKKRSSNVERAEVTNRSTEVFSNSHRRTVIRRRFSYQIGKPLGSQARLASRKGNRRFVALVI
jgi:hypothetical protein